MREIKFRAIPVGKDYFVYGYYAKLGKGENADHYIIQNGSEVSLFEKEEDSKYFNDVLIDLKTLGQATGLEDVKKKEAYTGDIFKQEGRKFRWMIYLSDGGARCCTTNEWNDTNGDPVLCEGLSDLQSSRWFIQNAEIVGNIWENPELMESVEK